MWHVILSTSIRCSHSLRGVTNLVLRACAGALLLMAAAWVAPARAHAFSDEYDREDYEEPAGSSFAVYFNPADNIYGISAGDGTWLKDTPVFGDFALGLFNNAIEDAFYSDIAMTLRVMPHWRVTPFVGAGGSYNLSLTSETGIDSAGLEDRGASYWGGHVEAGVRAWNVGGVRLIEVMVRYTWSSLPGDRDYFLVGISMPPGR